MVRRHAVLCLRGMKCDRCDREAVVHEVVIRNGERVEKHLCEQCASGVGLTGQGGPQIAELLSQFVGGSGEASRTARTGVRVDSCPSCGMTFTEFRKDGVLGCSSCYDAFEERLGPLIERAHEGATHHIGKRPPGGESAALAEATAPPAEALEALRLRREQLAEQLSEAVSQERYEKAAALRDEMRRIDAALSGSLAGADPDAEPPDPDGGGA